MGIRSLSLATTISSNRGALPRLRGREGVPPLERCLACEAERSEPLSVASLASPTSLGTSALILCSMRGSLAFVDNPCRRALDQ